MKKIIRKITDATLPMWFPCLLLVVSPFSLLASTLDDENDPLTIQSVTPYESHIGDTVEISGTGFSVSDPAHYKVYFNTMVYVNPTLTWYDSSRATIVSITATKLRVVIPPRSINGNISVYLDGILATANNDLYFHIQPTISSFTPHSAYQNDTITIVGTGFDGRYGDLVSLGNGLIVKPVKVNFTSIKFILPASAGAGPIRVLGSLPSVDALTILPNINYVSDHVTAVGREFELSVTAFLPDDIANYELTFNGTVALIEKSIGAIVITHVPRFATSGPLVLKYKGAIIRGSGEEITVEISGVRVDKVEPSKAKIGSAIVIRGEGFDQGHLKLFFANNKEATIDSLTDTAIYVHIPKGAYTGPINLVINGTSVYPLFNSGVTILENAMSIHPQRANVGDTVVISGNGFYPVQPDFYWILFPNGAIKVLNVTDTTISFIVSPQLSTSTSILRSSWYESVYEIIPLLSIPPKILSMKPDTVMHHHVQDLVIRGQSISDTTFFKIHFSDRVIIDSVKMFQGFIYATVPDSAETGPVFIEVNGEMSDSLMLVVLADTSKVVTAISVEVAEASIHPNPTSDFVILSGLQNPGDHANIITPIGTTISVSSTLSTIGEQKFDVQSLSSGVYILRTEDGKQIRSFRFIKL